jgi:hypothetical protein
VHEIRRELVGSAMPVPVPCPDHQSGRTIVVNSRLIPDDARHPFERCAKLRVSMSTKPVAETAFRKCLTPTRRITTSSVRSQAQVFSDGCVGMRWGGAERGVWRSRVGFEIMVVDKQSGIRFYLDQRRSSSYIMHCDLRCWLYFIPLGRQFRLCELANRCACMSGGYTCALTSGELTASGG